MNKYSDFMSESSLNRIREKDKKGGIAIMSAQRGDKSNKENRKRSQQLDRDIRGAGLPGATKVSGRYTENPGTEDEKKVGERSHVVSSGKMGKRKFKKAVEKLGKKYDQDSVLVKKKPKGDAALVGTNKSWPGEGHRVKTGKMHPGKTGEFDTKVKNKTFTYEELMERVMSMDDMNKVKGGTQKQREIAQERQRRREEKNKANATAAATSAKKPQPAQPQPQSSGGGKGGALVKSNALAKRPDPRKSQLGKWSQGIKSSPGKLAKRPETKPVPQNNVQKVKVKDDGMEGQRGNRPPSGGKEDVQNMKAQKERQEKKKRERRGLDLSRWRDLAPGRETQGFSDGDVGGPEVGRSSGLVG